MGMRLGGARRSRGQAMAEFALVAPIFLFVMLALIELGRAVYYTQVLDTAARDGARYAIVNGFESPCKGTGPTPDGSANCDPDGSDVIDKVQERAFGVIDIGAGDWAIHVKWCDTLIEIGASGCPNRDLGTGTLISCEDWGDPGVDPYAPLGDGDNGRGQMVSVCVAYKYQSLLSFFAPVIPDFTVNGGSSLVVNN